MNCTQAKVLLLTPQERTNGLIDTPALASHLEQCPACRAELAGLNALGEHVRALPPVEPAPDFQVKLLKALAAEHAQFLQRSPSAPPPPAFLKPYLKEHAYSSHKTDSLAAFSTADTGPLPVIERPQTKRRSTRLGYGAVLGLAAVFLMTVMMGGITSLLFLAQGHLPSHPQSGISSINLPINVVKETYITQTLYQHVVSAVADNSSIYYSAYGDGNNDGWMLEQLDRSTKLSTPLLSAASPTPLIVLGSQNGWLVWLQYDVAQVTVKKTILHAPFHASLRKWSIYSLALVGQAGIDSATKATPTLLASGTFDQQTVPDWVRTPVQGIWFLQNSILVATVDESGVSHLLLYPLGAGNKARVVELASANNNHILASPTANSDGSQIYWADEWRTDDDILHSNIWTQQILATPHSFQGHLVDRTHTTTQLFSHDGLSFRPEIVNDTLFLLSEASGSTSLLTGATTPAASSTPLATATPNTSASLTPIVDASIFPPALDTKVNGTLFMLPLDGDPNATPVQVSAKDAAYSLQAGTNFALWQSNEGDRYGMYDMVTHSYVNLGEVLNDAQFLSVNGSTAVWSVDTTPTTNVVTPTATLIAFDWPVN